MNVLWLQAIGCGGCTMSLLCAEDPKVGDALGGAEISFLWHPALSLETGTEVAALLDGIERGKVILDVLAVEGSVARGPRGTKRFQMLSGTGRSLYDWVVTLAPLAEQVVAVGTCSAFGG